MGAWKFEGVVEVDIVDVVGRRRVLRRKSVLRRTVISGSTRFQVVRVRGAKH